MIIQNFVGFDILSGSNAWNPAWAELCGEINFGTDDNAVIQCPLLELLINLVVFNGRHYINNQTWGCA